jgi:hypothetical protein
MANYCAKARTNYVNVTDEVALKTSIEGFDITVDNNSSGKVCLLSQGEAGWSLSREREASDSQEELQQKEAGESTVYTPTDDDTEEFSFEEHVMPFVKEGEVLVAVEVGDKKLCYLVGVAQAFVREGEEVKSFRLNLDDVYKLAAEQFNKSVDDITRAMY